MLWDRISSFILEKRDEFIFFFNWGAFQLSDKNEENQCIVVKSILFLFLVAEMTSLWLWY